MKFFSHTVPQSHSASSFADTSSPVRKNKKQSPFEIFNLKTMEEDFLSPPAEERRLHHFEIIWFSCGEGFIKIDTEIFQVKGSTVFCFIPGQVRRFMLRGGEDGQCIRFSPDFIFAGSPYVTAASWLNRYSSGIAVPVIEPDPDLEFEISQLFQAMQKEFNNYFLLRSEILAGLLNILLIHLSRRLQSVGQDVVISKDNELVHQFKMLLREQFISKKQVADYASDLCVTPNYLNKTVKKVTGFTASHHIQQHIILEAKRQLIHSNSSMKEIAYFLGFDNLAHFSKFFKNNSGMNFTSFKKGLSVANPVQEWGDNDSV